MKTRQKKDVLTKDIALKIALDALNYRMENHVGPSLLGWNHQMCVYRLPNGTLEGDLYAVLQVKGLGTSKVTLDLPGERNHGLEVLYRWTLDNLAKKYMK